MQLRNNNRALQDRIKHLEL
jgi:hypothetical protein